ncbi:Rv3235 family protein [Arthrobacter sp. ATA002]|uniref:Rv3235 family protein n=1 Tax=Arthrobacter sp. ATA002 TaxID=2991715 RepID=UPI0022A664AE|nr:Rv3235 family protein [Arthrobacter sp. ATA002]WAP52738.1 Rv3235 family protein [Arthrobacter sp. ATA002]
MPQHPALLARLQSAASRSPAIPRRGLRRSSSVRCGLFRSRPGRSLQPVPARRSTPRWQSDPEHDARVNAIARSVTQAALEVLGGTRPLQQMARWLDPASFERLQLRANLVRSRESGAARGPSGVRAGAGGRAPAVPERLHRQVVIRCCRICPVSEGVCEASVVAAEQNRVRAAALRIELRRGLWKITALEIG